MTTHDASQGAHEGKEVQRPGDRRSGRRLLRPQIQGVVHDVGF